MALLASELRESEGINTSLWSEPKEILATEDSAPEEPSVLPILWPFKGHLNKSLHNNEPSAHLKPQTRPKKGKGTKNPQRHVTGSERITQGYVGNSPWMVLLRLRSREREMGRRENINIFEENLIEKKKKNLGRQ